MMTGSASTGGSACSPCTHLPVTVFSSIRSSELNHERLRDPLNGAEDAHGWPRHMEERPRTGTTVDPITVGLFYNSS